MTHVTRGTGADKLVISTLTKIDQAIEAIEEWKFWAITNSDERKLFTLTANFAPIGSDNLHVKRNSSNYAESGKITEFSENRIKMRKIKE